MKTVVIVQHRLLHYRVELFEKIKLKLAENDVVLHLVHGSASHFDAKRKDESTLAWAEKIKNHFFRIRGVELLWQSLPSITSNCDLLVLMQENKILSNYHHIIKRKLSGKKVGYWGHGKNLQSVKPNGVREKWKKKWLLSVDWWFAYTKSTVDYLTEQSFNAKQITCLNNAIDTDKFKQQLNDVSVSDMSEIRNQLGISENAIIGIYCGSLYKEKLLELLISAADIIKEKVENFNFIVIGDGPDANIIKNATESRSWLSMVGVKKGYEKAKYYRTAKIVLNPGLVGLHILDSLCAGLPMVTTKNALHSPEYDYLQHKANGLVLGNSPEEYSEGVVDLLHDVQLYAFLNQKCIEDSNKYTVEAMANNFCEGIICSLTGENVL